MEELVGGWEFSGIYNFQSGVPVVFPTNSALFQGTDPKPVGQKSHSNWFDKTKFAAFPTSSVSKATLANTTIYPAWTGVTGMPGYSYSPASGNNIYNDFATWNTYFPTTFGDIRQPYTTAFTLGARKSFCDCRACSLPSADGCVQRTQPPAVRLCQLTVSKHLLRNAQFRGDRVADQLPPASAAFRKTDSSSEFLR